jgi:hypothetical protein
MRMRALAWIVAALCMGFTPNAFAASELVEAVQTQLHAGESDAAAQAAEERLTSNPDDDEARFALGAVQFFQAIENLGQNFHRYGLASGESPLPGLAGLPIFRLPVPPNPDPEKLDYEALRGILSNFADDLAKAQQTLAEVGDSEIDLPLNIGLIRLDFDGDGSGSEDESIARVLQYVGVGIDPATVGPLLVDFDASDVPWLRAYCHLLMGIADFLLAHDWHVAFENTFHSLFPAAGLPMSTETQAESEISMFAGGVDLVAFIHLLHWPVADAERLKSVLAHLEAVPPLSRENWARVRAETDSRKEWLPNPSQTGVLPGVTVTEEQIKGWMLFLDEFEALTKGEKLMPHWRFEKGINLRRLFLEPTTFDLVLLIQGSAAIPYLETGPLATRDTWREIGSLLGGNFFRYALWFN